MPTIPLTTDHFIQIETNEDWYSFTIRCKKCRFIVVETITSNSCVSFNLGNYLKVDFSHGYYGSTIRAPAILLCKCKAFGYTLKSYRYHPAREKKVYDRDRLEYANSPVYIKRFNEIFTQENLAIMSLSGINLRLKPIGNEE